MIPLQYESLKTVLRYMKADLRLELSRRIPSIRTAEKVVPLRIDHMSFDGFKVGVNDAKYDVRLFVPYDLENDRLDQYSFTHIDLDKYGIKEYFDDVMTPGDVWIHDKEVESEKLEIQNQSELEKAVRLNEKALELSARDGDIFKIDESWDTVEDHEEMRMLISQGTDQLEWSLDNLRAQLVPFYRRRARCPFPYSPVLQIRIEFPKRHKLINYKYTMKLNEATKRLYTFLFGSRPLIQVRLLELNCRNRVLRLPEQFRIKVRQLKNMSHLIQTHECLKSFVDESSYPLDVFYTLCNHKPEGYECEAMKTARKVFLFCYDGEEEMLFPLLIKLQNPLVQVNGDYFFFAEDQVRLVELWFENGKEIGTILRYYVDCDTDWSEFSDLVSNMGSVAYGEKQILLPMPNNKQLEIRHTEFKAAKENWTDWNEHEFNMEFRVTSAGNIPFVNGISSLNEQMSL